MQQKQHHRIWQLRLVPNVPRGRLLTGSALFLLTFLFFYVCNAIGPDAHPDDWPAALFFCVVIAYFVPVFHFITARTQRALDDLAPTLGMDAAEHATTRHNIEHKSLSWLLVNLALGVVMWFAQSWILAGGMDGMLQITQSPARFAIAIGPLPVWILANQSIHALIDNASLFRRLSDRVNVDLLDTRELRPFGDMAISSTLMVIGAIASLGLLWVNGQSDPWTTIPGLAAMSAALVFLFCAPIWPIRHAIKRAKSQELDRVQSRLASHNGASAPEQLAPLLTYRREVSLISEWPFDTTSLARFGIYLFIVPLTWVGAALIEILVDGVLAG